MWVFTSLSFAEPQSRPRAFVVRLQTKPCASSNSAAVLSRSAIPDGSLRHESFGTCVHPHGNACRVLLGNAPSQQLCLRRIAVATVPSPPV